MGSGQGVQDGLGTQGVQAGNGNHGARTTMRRTPIMSGLILRWLVDLVGQGVKTDKGFKEVHVNNVARALTDFSGQEVFGTQVYNHLRKWRQRWVKVCRLKDLSGANWDENTYSILLDDEHVLDNFGSGQATGRFAMGSNEPLGTPSLFPESNMTTEGFTQDVAAGFVGASVGVGGTPSGGTPAGSVGGGAAAATAASVNANGAGPSGSQGTKSTEKGAHLGKRRRSLTEDEVGIMNGLTGAVNRVADAFQAPVQVQKTEVHPELYSLCMSTPGFMEEDLMTALTHPLDNKCQGDGFVRMTEPHRVLWIRQYLARLREKEAARQRSDSEK
ncbi:hypothetical protein QOZ80_6BG0489680 [Eleusine coracana subsp. coracana]|nr:hypothetical protein QOZ80_6BG0489680 [Eleusine coracana subsp. coracana]